MPEATANHTAKAPTTACGDVVDFTRLRYFHGRALGALDLRREQDYFLEKSRLRNRLLHGWGIVCGLGVEVVDVVACEGEAPPPAVLVVAPGVAIDGAGNEVVVRNPREIVLAALLSDDELDSLRHPNDYTGRPRVHLTLCYHEQLTDPARPLLTAACEPVAACEYGRVCETYRICASTTAPDRGPECEPCCGGCGGGCVELAAIDNFDPDAVLTAEQLILDARRPLAVHDLTEIVALNWTHGATYDRDQATRLLDEGLTVRFSRPVQVASLDGHVVDVVTIEGGGGRAGSLYSVPGVVDYAGERSLVDSLTFRSTSGETLQYGDRVVITIHGDFILDECCRAVDANHVGGAIPSDANSDDPYPSSVPERRCPPRRSGNGSEGGDFISWISVGDKKGVT